MHRVDGRAKERAAARSEPHRVSHREGIATHTVTRSAPGSRLDRRRSGRRAAAPLAAGLLLALSLAAHSQSVDPGAAVFQLINVDTTTGRPGVTGTAFVIAADGTALTNSHVVYPAAHHPERYRLLALVGQEFYSASVVCASTLPYDPTQPPPATGVPLGRDVAEIQLGPSTFPFATWGYRFADGAVLTTGTAHRGALPVFPALTVGGGPTPGGHVRVTGFGHRSPIAVRVDRRRGSARAASGPRWDRAV